MDKNVESVKKFFEAMNSDNISEGMTIFTDDVVRIEPTGLPDSGTYHGKKVIEVHFKKARSTWAEGECAPVDYKVIGNKVVVLSQVRVRLKNRTDWIEAPVTDVFTFVGDKAVEMRFFQEHEDAIKWATSN